MNGKCFHIHVRLYTSLRAAHEREAYGVHHAMNTLSSPLRPQRDLADPASRAPSVPGVRPRRGDSLIYLGLAGLLVLAWKVSRAGLFEPGDNVGYWMGVAGGVMMLLLLLYPLRKYVKLLQGLGRVKLWLWGHMVLGIGGPLLILVHCTFRTGSTNAAVALWSMVVVAASGVVGRVLYTRVNRGLLAERAALRDFKVLANQRRSRRRRALAAPALHPAHRELAGAPALLARREYRTAPPGRRPGLEPCRVQAAPPRGARSHRAAPGLRDARGAVRRLGAPVRAVARGPCALRLPARGLVAVPRLRGACLLSLRLTRQMCV
jgi:hypothetical protein